MTAPERVAGRHAQYVGWMCGIARKNGVPLLPVLADDGGYSDQLGLSLFPAGTEQRLKLTVVVPPPPDDWRPEGP